MKCRECRSPYGQAKLIDDTLSAVWVCAECGHRQTWEADAECCPTCGQEVRRLWSIRQAKGTTSWQS